MTDIVKRLRRYSCESDDPSEALAELVKDMHDAADEIERLRGALERIAELYYPAEIQRIAREALREVGDE